MTARKDTFGKALVDAFTGVRAIASIRRDDGYVDQEEISYYFTSFEEFPQIEKDAMAIAHSIVLDVGCGAGRHSLYLQSKGIEVVSLDISQLAIQVARKRGVKAPVLGAAPWLPFRRGSFGTSILMFNNFGICGGYEKTVAFLKELNRVLAPDGHILASSLHPTLTSNENHLQYHELNRKRKLPVGLVTIRIEYGGESGDWFKLLLAAPDEMEMLCKRAGLELTRTLGPDGGPFYIGVIKRV